MSVFRSIITFALVALAACTQEPSPKNLAGEWCQDINYFQSKNLINQAGEIVAFEDYELFFATDRLAATRLVGKEPDEKRVYWASPLSFATDSSGGYQITFTSHDGEPITAAVSFDRKHLILEIGKRRMGFLRGRATNLRIKEYVPKS